MLLRQVKINDQLNHPVSASRSNLWIILSAIACLAFGAIVTHWLMSNESAEIEAGNSAPRQGKLFRAPLTPSVAPTANPKATRAPIQTQNNSEYASVSFDALAGFFYVMPDADDLVSVAASSRKNQIPAPIHAFNGKRIAVQGFMMPLKVEKGDCKAFLLVRDQGICCFRRTPRMNEWICVSMKNNQSTRLITDRPITVFGEFSVGEAIEKGMVTSIYRLVADEISGPLNL